MPPSLQPERRELTTVVRRSPDRTTAAFGSMISNVVRLDQPDDCFLRGNCAVKMKCFIMCMVMASLMIGCVRASRVDDLEQQCRRLQYEVDKMKKEKDKGRGEYAEANAALDSVRSEMQALRGEQEQIAFRLDSHIKEYKSWRQAQEGPSSPAEPSGDGSPAEGPRAGAPVSGQDAGASTEPPADEDTLYDTGRQRLNAADYSGARAAFEKMVQLYPKSEQCDNALFWIGETYYREKNFEKAILEYQKIIDKYPKGNKFPAALLKQGLAFKEIRDDVNARLRLKQVIRDFPDSEEAKLAGQRLKEL
jgi:tol-pal system protein YbgF